MRASGFLVVVLAFLLLFSWCAVFHIPFIPVIYGTTSQTNLAVNGFVLQENTSSAWHGYGTSPWLDAIDNPTNVVNVTNAASERDLKRFTFQTVAISSVTSVTICVYAKYSTAATNLKIYVLNSTNGVQGTLIKTQALTSSYAWYNFTCTSTLPKGSQVNRAGLRLGATRGSTGGIAQVDMALLTVVYTSSIQVQPPIQGSVTGATPTLTVTLASAPTAGNTLVATIGAYFSSGGLGYVSSIVETGVTWSLAVNTSASTNKACEIWYGIVAAGASVTITITYTRNIGNSAVADVAEYDIVAVLDATKTNSSATSTATTDTGTTVTTAQPNELWVGCASVVNRNQSSPTNGFDMYDGITTTGIVTTAYLEKIVTAVGTANTGTTLSSTSSWSACIATFLYSTPQPIISDFYVNSTQCSAGVQWDFSISDSLGLKNSTFWWNNGTTDMGNTTIDYSGTSPLSVDSLFNSTLPSTAQNVTFQCWAYNAYNWSTTGVRWMLVYPSNASFPYYVNLGTVISSVENAVDWTDTGSDPEMLYNGVVLNQNSTDELVTMIDGYAQRYAYVSTNTAGNWQNPTYAYDNNTATGANRLSGGVSGVWMDALILNLSSAVTANRIDYRVSYGAALTVSNMSIQIANATGDWVNFYNATPNWLSTAEIVSTTSDFSAVKYSFYSISATNAQIFVNETYVNIVLDPSILSSANVLKWSAICNKLNITQYQNVRNDIIWALNNITMVGSLPKTTTAGGSNEYISYGDPVFSPEDKWALYGFYFANNSWANADMAKWNITAAYSFFNSSVYGYSANPPLYIGVSGTLVYWSLPRYYDEGGCTIECYVLFSQVLNVSGAMNDALYWWSYMDSGCWSNNYGGYYKYRIGATEPAFECEAAFFLKVISILKYYNANLTDWYRILQDVGNRFLSQKWQSYQYLDSSNLTAYIVRHEYIADPTGAQTRLVNTLGEWQALLGAFAQFNLTYQADMTDMLFGNLNDRPAWANLLSSYAALYNSIPQLFKVTSAGSTSSAATAQAEVLLWMLGIVPGNTTVAFPLEELAYEYTQDIDPALFAMNYTAVGEQITIPINSAGTLTFQYGCSPISQYFSQGGIWRVQFTGSWNNIASATYLGALPSNVIYFSQLYAIPVANFYGNTTNVAGASGTIYSYWTDSAPNIYLSGFVFATNNTGPWVISAWDNNASLGWGGTQATAWGNKTFTFNSTVGNTVAWNMSQVNDTATAQNLAIIVTQYVVLVAGFTAFTLSLSLSTGQIYSVLIKSNFNFVSAMQIGQTFTDTIKTQYQVSPSFSSLSTYTVNGRTFFIITSAVLSSSLFQSLQTSSFTSSLSLSTISQFTLNGRTYYIINPNLSVSELFSSGVQSQFSLNPQVSMSSQFATFPQTEFTVTPQLTTSQQITIQPQSHFTIQSDWHSLIQYLLNPQSTFHISSPLQTVQSWILNVLRTGYVPPAITSNPPTWYLPGYTPPVLQPYGPSILAILPDVALYIRWPDGYAILGSAILLLMAAAWISSKEYNRRKHRMATRARDTFDWVYK